MVDIDVGMLSEALNDKLDRDGMNAGNPCAVVIETSPKEILPSWYRVYSDGWCEQGGKTDSDYNDKRIDLIKIYSNTNYNCMVTGIKTSAFNDYSVACKPIDNSTISLSCPSQAEGLFWQASGYIR